MSDEEGEGNISDGARELLFSWPFTMIPAKAMLDHNLKDGALRLLSYMCWRRNEKGELWPSVSTMALDLGLTEPSVRKRLKELLDGEYVMVTYREGQTSVYTLTPKGFYRGGVKEPLPKQEASAHTPEEDFSDGVPSEAGPPNPRSFHEWVNLLREAKNKPAVMVHMFRTLYPDREPPSFGRVGKVASEIGDLALFAKYVWDTASRPPAGSVINYVLGIHKGEAKRNGGTNEPAGMAGIR